MMTPIIKILIAEHDQHDLEMIDAELKREGFNFISETVETEAGFKKALDRFLPDVILCDYSFPSFDGLAAFQIREQIAPETPFILISGAIGEENSIELIKNGVTDFVLKDRIFTLHTKLARALKDIDFKKQKNKAAEELLKSETHLAEAQKMAKMGSWDYDIEADLLTWSKELYNVFRVDSKTFKHTFHSFEQVADDEDKQILQKISRKLLLTGAPYSIEYHITTLTGDKRVISGQGYGQKDKTGKVTHLFGTAQDITSTKKSERLIRESEKRYRRIVETAQEGIWMIDENHQTSFVNNKMCEILEYTEAEMMGKDIYFFMDEEGKHIAADLMEKKKQGHAGQNNFKYLSKTGKEVWANLSANPLFGEDGTYQGSLAMVTDITQNKKAEERNQFKATLLNTIGQAAIATDLEGKINFWNKAASQIYGWTEEEVLGKNIINITTPQHRVDQAEQIMQKLMQGNSWSGEFIVRRKDGNEFPAFVTNAPIQDQQQKLIGIIGVSYDITKQKQAEQELKDSNERFKLSEFQLKDLNENLRKQTTALTISNAELEQFAYVASHDLQEPLRMVSSFLKLLEKKYDAVIDDKGKQYIGFAVDGAKRMHQIILDLLEFSRVGKTEDKQERIELNELIDEIKILFRKQIIDKDAVIISDSLPSILGFRSPLRQVFQNLISNALKYTVKDRGAKINITSTELEHHWQFTVHDNGIGIENEYFNKIFIIFQRLHTNNEYAGTGMGLAITKKIIETHGGSIWVESEVGKGSTFYFTLLKH